MKYADIFLYHSNSRMEVGGNSLPIVVSKAVGREILRNKFNKESTRSIKIINIFEEYKARLNKYEKQNHS